MNPNLKLQGEDSDQSSAQKAERDKLHRPTINVKYMGRSKFKDLLLIQSFSNVVFACAVCCVVE